jgi:chitinase
MAFDYIGFGFYNFTGHLSNVYTFRFNPATTDFNTAQAIDYYESQISFSRNTIFGISLYGRSFANTAGLGQKFNGSGDGTWDAGVLDYKALPLNNSIVSTDKKVVASWSCSIKTRQLVDFD